MESPSSSWAWAILEVTSGTLTNKGTLDANLAGTGTSHRIKANIDNHGAINFNTSVWLTKPSGVFTNTGTVNIAAGTTLTAAQTGQVFNQNAGTFTIGGTPTVSYGIFNQNGEPRRHARRHVHGRQAKQQPGGGPGTGGTGVSRKA